MKPYYEHAGITIYHGDCREVLPMLEPVDLVLTDPPFGVGEAYGQFNDTRTAVSALISDIFPSLRVIAKTIGVTPGVNNIWLYPQADWVISLYVTGATARCKWGFNCHWPILVYGGDPYLRAGKGCRPDIIHGKLDDIVGSADLADGHPCPKPLMLWRRILHRLSASPLEVVLDPFLGSGTTLVAAKDTHRRAIGIEIEEKYCEISAKRLSQEVLSF